MKNHHIELLFDFLNTPLDSGDTLFRRFAVLPGAIAEEGTEPLRRYVYIPGTRKDRVVLVAHLDTVWDKAYNAPFSEARSVIFENGIFKSANPACGIGADDRAGCAILWELRNCGHSILLTDGEEHGKLGANYLKTTNPRLFRTLNRHRYMIEFDWKGTNCCLFNQVDNTKRFKKHVADKLGFVDSHAHGGTDLGVLCRRICGVNLGIGYDGWHTRQEQLVLSDWENTLEKVRIFLNEKQSKFYCRILPRYIRFAKRCIGKIKRILLTCLRKNTSV